MRILFALVTTLALFTLACSSSGRGTRTGAGSSSSVISMDELATTARLDAFEAVRRLRPMWLRGRGPVSMELQERAGVRIYVNGVNRGQAPELKDIRSTDVESIRYLSSGQATIRFGIDHPDGAILVTLRRGRGGAIDPT